MSDFAPKEPTSIDSVLEEEAVGVREELITRELEAKTTKTDGYTSLRDVSNKVFQVILLVDKSLAVESKTETLRRVYSEMLKTFLDDPIAVDAGQILVASFNEALTIETDWCFMRNAPAELKIKCKGSSNIGTAIDGIIERIQAHDAYLTGIPRFTPLLVILTGSENASEYSKIAAKRLCELQVAPKGHKAPLLVRPCALNEEASECASELHKDGIVFGYSKEDLAAFRHSVHCTAESIVVEPAEQVESRLLDDSILYGLFPADSPENGCKIGG